MPKQITKDQQDKFDDFMRLFHGSVNEPNSEGSRPLNFALENADPEQRLEMVEILLSQGANPALDSDNLLSSGGTIRMNAAGYAAACGYAEPLLAMIEIWPDVVNTRTGRDNTSLIELAIIYSDQHKNFPELMTKLNLSLDFLNARNCNVGGDKVSPLTFAVANNKPGAVEWFMQKEGVSLATGIPSCPNVLDVAKGYEFSDVCYVIGREKPELAQAVAPKPSDADVRAAENAVTAQKLVALKAKMAKKKGGDVPKDDEAGPAEASPATKYVKAVDKSEVKLPINIPTGEKHLMPMQMAGQSVIGQIKPYLPSQVPLESDVAVDPAGSYAMEYTPLMSACGAGGHGVKSWAEVRKMQPKDINAKLVAPHKDVGKTAFYFACQPSKGSNPITLSDDQARMDAKVSLSRDEANRIEVALTLVRDVSFSYNSNNYAFKAGVRDVTFSTFKIAMTANSPKLLDAICARFGQIDLEEMSSTKTYLTWAVQDKSVSPKVLEWLVKHGADVNVQYAKKSAPKMPFIDLCEQANANPPMPPEEVKNIHAKARLILNSDRFDIKKIKADTGKTVMHYAVDLKDTRTVHDVCEKYPALVIESDNQGATPLQFVARLYPNALQGAKDVLNAIAAELIHHGANLSEIAGIINLSEVDIAAAHAKFMVQYATLDMTYAA